MVRFNRINLCTIVFVHRLNLLTINQCLKLQVHEQSFLLKDKPNKVSLMINDLISNSIRIKVYAVNRNCIIRVKWFISTRDCS
jgi:hypothetical protein